MDGPLFDPFTKFAIKIAELWIKEEWLSYWIPLINRLLE